MLADEHWAWLPGDGCLHECFVAACVRAGFTPKTGYESDAATCVEMSRTGRAVTLCLPTRRAPGVVVRPIAGAPLRWVHAMVWREEDAGVPGPPAGGGAASAYREVVDEAPEYEEWLTATRRSAWRCSPPARAARSSGPVTDLPAGSR